jgi:hypothetical protein
MGGIYGPSIVTDNLVLCLDAANSRSYPGSGTTWFDLSGSNNHFTLFNSPTFGSGALTFNGTNQYAASAANIDLNVFNSVTIIVAIRATTLGTWPTRVYEHTLNDNTNPGGLGVSINSSGFGAVTDLTHTNHNSGGGVPRNYYVNNMGTNWVMHANVFSKISDPTGRLAYANGAQQPFTADDGGYPTNTATLSGQFANSTMYLCSRAGTTAFQPGQLAFFMIYNRKLSAAEVQQHFDAFRGRFAI